MENKKAREDIFYEEEHQFLKGSQFTSSRGYR